MELQKFIQKKYIRLLNSSKVLKFFFYYHKLFNNKGMKDIGFDFRKKKNRLFIVQDIIQKKNYKSYLEIGCFKGSSLWIQAGKQLSMTCRPYGMPVPDISLCLISN